MRAEKTLSVKSHSDKCAWHQIIFPPSKPVLLDCVTGEFDGDPGNEQLDFEYLKFIIFLLELEVKKEDSDDPFGTIQLQLSVTDIVSLHLTSLNLLLKAYGDRE